MARIGLGVAQSNPNIVYLITEYPTKGTLFRSEDHGETWRMLTELAAAMRDDVHLFQVRTATRWERWNRDSNLGSRTYQGQNPQDGARVSLGTSSRSAASASATCT